jgi:hypothetical protein
MLIGFSIYLIYSASGGLNGIKGLNEKIWWQFIVSFLPFIFGAGFIISSQS